MALLSVALLGVSLKLGFQRRQLGERRVRIRRFLAPLEPRWTIGLPFAIAIRPVGTVFAAKMLATTLAAMALARMALVPDLSF